MTLLILLKKNQEPVFPDYVSDLPGYHEKMSTTLAARAVEFRETTVPGYPGYMP